MLLSFSVENFKSFVSQMTFSMHPASKQVDLSYSILKETIKNKEIKAICTSVIYGPNAAGKSNVIGAMDVLKKIVLRGNIRNIEEGNNPDPASAHLELIPNCCLKKQKPVRFSISFTQDNHIFDYSLTIDFGDFGNQDYDRNIKEETLSIDQHHCFTRSKNTVTVQSFSLHKGKGIAKEMPLLETLATKGLVAQELFLTNGFKSIFEPQLVASMVTWFSDKLLVVYRSNSIKTSPNIKDAKGNTCYILKQTNDVAKKFGAGFGDIGYFTKDGEQQPKLVSLFPKRKLLINAEQFESYGTVRFMNLFPILWKTIQDGITLLIDEFDASLHPMAVMSLINVFHNDEINTHGAQLIFNTQNPIFLNSNLFRRDEIKFVERNHTSKESMLYALSDFKTNGKNGVRKGEDYLRNYFISKYGALEDIDLSPLFANQENDNGDN
ncbi:MAG: ATP-binding protein [Spirochaetia bacterium]|jgi:AAA15 family ATPase/GTPase|nr:ATP-binding protein [Spirochaetia bacterium]